MSSDPSTLSYDFFISYTGRDEAWAEWIAWHLKEQGYTLRLQKWHFNAGNSWVVEMQNALQKSRRMIAVLSPDYLKSKHGQAEWNVFYAKDPDGAQALLIPVRVAQVVLDDLHKTRNYIDFVGKDEAGCLEALLQGIQPLEPRVKPTFPATAKPPVFPPVKPPASAIPHNLPRLPFFFGRDKELKTIADALSPKTRTWGVLIDGPGGMGKTSLAIRSAELCPEGQFQRILFLSSKERMMTADGEHKLSDFIVPGYLDMLNEIARQIKKPDLAKRPESERARLVIDALESENALLILDNLESLPRAQQNKLFEFLSQLPQGCKAIVTSRRRTDVDARIIRLDKLDEQASLNLLEELATDRPLLAKSSKAERLCLYEETGGNPLLLRWIAGQLGKGRCQTIASALEFLRSAPPTNDPLEFIFGDLLDTFTENETKVLAALTYFTQLVEVQFIADLAGLSKTATATALMDLASRALVIPDEEDISYSLVPMVADFLRRRRPEVVAETGAKLEQRAYSLVVSNGWGKHDQFPILESNWPTIAPALPLILKGDNEKLQKTCAALSEFLNFSGRWDEWLALSQGAEQRALASGDHEGAGWLAYHAGFAHSLRSQATLILECANRALEHWKHGKVSELIQVAAVSLRGKAFSLIGDDHLAIQAHESAVNILRTQHGNPNDLASALNYLACSELNAGNYSESEKHYNEAISIAQTSGDLTSVALYTGNLSLLALARKQWQIAETLARQALALIEKSGRKSSIAADCHCLARALLEQGRAGDALPYALRAKDILEELGSPLLEEALSTLRACRRDLALTRLNHGWTYNTTTLEGNTLSLSEVSLALDDPTAVIANRPAEHVAATRAQGEALKLLAKFLETNCDWTTEDLFRMHTVLMHGSTVDYLKPVGTWKIEDNGTPVKLDGKRVWNESYAAAHHVQALMEVWLRELNRRREGSGDPLNDHVWLHATFVRIHPFADGNGRMARLLANLPLLAAGLDPVDIPAAARERYLESLARWQIACGAPRPNAPLFEQPDLLKDFIALCTASRANSTV